MLSADGRAEWAVRAVGADLATPRLVLDRRRSVILKPNFRLVQAAAEANASREEIVMASDTAKKEVAKFVPKPVSSPSLRFSCCVGY